MTRDEVITAIKKLTEELGHVPSFPELRKLAKVSKRAIRTNFCTYTAALRACGLERQGGGYLLSPKSLFVDWAGVVRRLGKIPTIMEYELLGKYSLRPMLRLFGMWKQVPVGLLEYGRREGLEGEWGDVLDVVAGQLGDSQQMAKTSVPANGLPIRPRLLTNEPVYGAPMMAAPLTYAPTNEAGVVFLFGTVARELGFAVTRVQIEFPDCEAMREVQPDRWQRVRIEFEYESRNFLTHLHPVDKCDLIVCWSHNWPECPLEVLELKTAVRGVAADCADKR